MVFFRKSSFYDISRNQVKLQKFYLRYGIFQKVLFYDMYDMSVFGKKFFLRYGHTNEILFMISNFIFDSWHYGHVESISF